MKCITSIIKLKGAPLFPSTPIAENHEYHDHTKEQTCPMEVARLESMESWPERPEEAPCAVGKGCTIDRKPCSAQSPACGWELLTYQSPPDQASNRNHVRNHQAADRQSNHRVEGFGTHDCCESDNHSEERGTEDGVERDFESHVDFAEPARVVEGNFSSTRVINFSFSSNQEELDGVPKGEKVA